VPASVQEGKVQEGRTGGAVSKETSKPGGKKKKTNRGDSMSVRRIVEFGGDGNPPGGKTIQERKRGEAEVIQGGNGKKTD